MLHLCHIWGCQLTCAVQRTDSGAVRCSIANSFPVEHALEVLLASAEGWSEAAQQAALDAMQQGAYPRWCC